MHSHTFLYGPNAAYLTDLYARYLRNPKAIDTSWAAFFNGLGDDLGLLALDPAEIGRTQSAIEDMTPVGKSEPAVTRPTPETATDSLRALLLINAYRHYGHLIAKLDPLGLSDRASYPALDPSTYGFAASDLTREVAVYGVLGFETVSLGDLIAALTRTYCGTVGIEYMHIEDPEQRDWIQNAIEAPTARPNPDVRRWILDRLTESETLEHFMEVKFPSAKRFGMEGSESQLPLFGRILERVADLGVREVVIGPGHRGRTNFMANVMRKPLAAIFSEVLGRSSVPEGIPASSDIPYHLGCSTDVVINGHPIHLSMFSNASHVEAFISIALGKVRAKRSRARVDERDSILGLMVHTDAGFVGQGVCWEFLQLSRLAGYETGGSIHAIVNNQIGFTTMPSEGRSSTYCTDAAKGVQAPVFHVNGDDPESVVRVADLAVDYHRRFRHDIIIDLVCYRRRGHNEQDEPLFTQPVMYSCIAERPTVRTLYADHLIEEGVVGPDEVDAMAQKYRQRYEEGFQAAQTYRPNRVDWLEGAWTGLTSKQAAATTPELPTGVPVEHLRDLGTASTRTPDSFHLNSKIDRQFEARRQSLENGKDINWATAELLAFGSLLTEGTVIRLSGQDAGRGTFSHRHGILHDQETGETRVPLQHIADGQASFELINSPLSEYSVLGFEYGYSVADPHALVLWEAQFGDFANIAQVIIDQYVAAAEDKWFRQSGLVMLLPHGLEGAGPEHSSARLERFLQLCANDNLQVVNCSTPANYFHVLRRQILRPFRKPLIVLSPKSLLRHRLAVSRLEDMGPESRFQPVLPEIDPMPKRRQIRRVILCSGKVYYDLLESRRERKIDDIAILRIEELYPFPEELLARELARFPEAEPVWCQEEPANMGAWTFMDRRLEGALNRAGTRDRRPRYMGRPESPSPADGIAANYREQQAALVDAALTIGE